MEQTTDSERNDSQTRKPRKMSSKQEALLRDLLDGEELKEAECYVFGQILESKVSTSKEASVLISHILGLLNFRRQFGEQ